MQRVGLLAATTLLSSCVTGTYRRINIGEPRPDAVVQPLLEEASELQDCLDSLGAPNFVWPTDDGTAVAYTHSHQKGWGLRVSAALRRVTGSVAVNSSLERGEAWVLFFDPDWNLLFLRHGMLADILQDHPRRVQPIPPRE